MPTIISALKETTKHCKESTGSRDEVNEDAFDLVSRINVDSDDNGEEAGSDADVADEDEEMMD